MKQEVRWCVLAVGLILVCGHANALSYLDIVDDMSFIESFTVFASLFKAAAAAATALFVTVLLGHIFSGNMASTLVVGTVGLIFAVVFYQIVHPDGATNDGFDVSTPEVVSIEQAASLPDDCSTGVQVGEVLELPERHRSIEITSITDHGITGVDQYGEQVSLPQDSMPCKNRNL